MKKKVSEPDHPPCTPYYCPPILGDYRGLSLSQTEGRSSEGRILDENIGRMWVGCRSDVGEGEGEGQQNSVQSGDFGPKFTQIS